jgi:deoxyribodipyrimidine photo-lyase
MTAPTTLLPTPAYDDAAAWTAQHLGHLARDEVRASPAFRGGQTAADAALAAFDVTGYAATRSQVHPASARGASRLSPYVRHGLIPLAALWAHVAGGPPRDVEKYRDELLWQEYARHLYARTGGTRTSLRYAVRERGGDQARWADDVASMACLGAVSGELERDGWMVNQARMWTASHWSVRRGLGWRDGDDLLFAHLLDGSRAANRLGWQWTVGAGTGKPYGFSRWQVEKRAPGLCSSCPLSARCPVQQWPDGEMPEPAPEVLGVRRDADPSATAGPAQPWGDGPVDAVWLTAESLGDDDPALAAHPDAPAVLVLDEPLLGRLRLSGKRLVFLVESLADLALRREVEVHLGDPVAVLAGRSLATTFAPVPGWRRRAAGIRPAVVHPWPWLVRPHAGPAGSFTAWRKAARV